jgi:hypothetical protein
VWPYSFRWVSCFLRIFRPATNQRAGESRQDDVGRAGALSWKLPSNPPRRHSNQRPKRWSAAVAAPCAGMSVKWHSPPDPPWVRRVAWSTDEQMISSLCVGTHVKSLVLGVGMEVRYFGMHLTRRLPGGISESNMTVHQASNNQT